MSIITKFTLLYLIVTLIVLLVGGVIVFDSVQHEIDKEEALELRGWLDKTAERIGRGVSLERLNHDPVSIVILPPTAPETRFSIYDTVAMHRQLQRPERHLKASASYRIGDVHYLISAYDVMVESDDIVDAITTSLSKIVLLLLFFVLITAIVISRRLMLPFNKTLRSIGRFNLTQQSALALPATNTREFKQLNSFLSAMTSKAKDDYRSLKEFSENASHEMQTPLSVIRGKLELLMEAQEDQERARLIASAHDAVEKLSRMGQGLTLLTKLTNQEFQEQKDIPLSSIVHGCLDYFEDLIEMKNLTLRKAIEPDVAIRFNPALLDLLLNNLIGNAIRHNVSDGSISVTLTGKTLLIENTGPCPEVPTELLFERFKKGNQSGESVGLGLAIVKQIVTISHASINYQFITGLHTITVNFAK